METRSRVEQAIEKSVNERLGEATGEEPKGLSVRNRVGFLSEKYLLKIAKDILR